MSLLTDHGLAFANRSGPQWRFYCRCGLHFTDPSEAGAAEKFRRHKAQYEPEVSS